MVIEAQIAELIQQDDLFAGKHVGYCDQIT
jgi:hypothetical protein